LFYFFIANGTRLRAVENAPALRRIIFRFPVFCIFRRFLCVFPLLSVRFRPVLCTKKVKIMPKSAFSHPKIHNKTEFLPRFQAKIQPF